MFLQFLICTVCSYFLRNPCFVHCVSVYDERKQFVFYTDNTMFSGHDKRLNTLLTGAFLNLAKHYWLYLNRILPLIK